MSIRELDLPFEKECKNCNGFGYFVTYDTKMNCSECKGTGKVSINDIVLELEDEEK